MVGFMEITGASGCVNRRISYKLFTGNHRNTILLIHTGRRHW